MKVLQVLYSGLGGHGSVVTSLVKADRQGEWEHQLLFYGIEDLLPAYRNFCETEKVPYAFIKKNPGSFRDSWKAVKQQLENFAPDVILLHSPVLIIPAWQYARKHKVRLLVTEHTPHAVKVKSEKLFSVLSLIKAEKVICLSRDYLDGLARQFPFLPVRRKAVVIPNGIDLDFFYPKPREKNGDIHAGMIGRFSNQKNQALIVEAAIKGYETGVLNPSLHFHFAGTGETEAALRQQIREKGLEDRVHFHGLLDENGIREFLSGLDIYLHASFAETMCTSVMQAMACGLPVIGSDIPGINDITRNAENALLFPASSSVIFLDTLCRLLDASLRSGMGQQARQWAEQHFSSVSTFRSYQALMG